MLPEFMAIAERALEAARLGLPVFPLWWPRNGGCSCRAGADCRQPGKHPRILGWQTEATRDEVRIREWWAKWPTANIGIVTGRYAEPSFPGILVLDVDATTGGIESLAALEALHGPLPDTVEVQTGKADSDHGRGRHLYFRHPEIAIGNSVKKLGDGLDVRSDGGLVVGPGSTHASGLVYEWEAAHHPEDTPFAEAPSWLLDMLLLRPRPALPGAPTAWSEPDGLPPVDDRIARARRWLADREPAVAGQGGSAQTMGICAVVTRGFALERDEDVFEALADWNARCSPPWDDRPDAPAAESLLRKIREGRSKGHVISIGEKLTPPRRVYFGGQLADAAAIIDGNEDSGAPGDLGDPDLQQPGGQQPKILVITGAAGELSSLVRISELALRTQAIYGFGGNLVTVRNGDGGPSLMLTAKDSLRVMVNRVVGFAKPQGKEYKTCWPPDEVLGALLNQGQWELPEIKAVVEAPTLRPDGSVVAGPGFDERSGIVFVSGSVDWQAVPELPTQDDVVSAFWWLGEPLRDFPFRAAHHRVAAMAAIITAIIRPAIAGPAPMFLFDATTPGTGKGLLASVVAMIATGRRAPVVPPVEDSDEMRKLITSLAMSGARIAIFDNVTKPIGGPPLDAAVTGTRWQERMLGTNRMFDGPLRPFWGATGNNLRVKGDMHRRVVPIRMASPLEDPESRHDFAYPNLIEWVGEHRPQLVAAALTVVRAYIAAGRPRPSGLARMGGFEEWDELVRAPLIWQGAPDILEGRREISQEEGETAAFRSVLETWARAFRDEACTLQWLKRATDGAGDGDIGQVREALIELAPAKDGKDWDPGRARYVFRRYQGRIFGGLCLVAGDRARSGVNWRVEGQSPEAGV